MDEEDQVDTPEESDTPPPEPVSEAPAAPAAEEDESALPAGAQPAAYNAPPAEDLSLQDMVTGALAAPQNVVDWVQQALGIGEGVKKVGDLISQADTASRGSRGVIRPYMGTEDRTRAQQQAPIDQSTNSNLSQPGATADETSSPDQTIQNILRGISLLPDRGDIQAQQETAGGDTGYTGEAGKLVPPAPGPRQSLTDEGVEANTPGTSMLPQGPVPGSANVRWVNGKPEPLAQPTDMSGGNPNRGKSEAEIIRGGISSVPPSYLTPAEAKQYRMAVEATRGSNVTTDQKFDAQGNLLGTTTKQGPQKSPMDYMMQQQANAAGGKNNYTEQYRNKMLSDVLNAQLKAAGADENNATKITTALINSGQAEKYMTPDPKTGRTALQDLAKGVQAAVQSGKDPNAIAQIVQRSLQQQQQQQPQQQTQQQPQPTGGITRISSAKEYAALPPGTPYIDPNGIPRFKPAVPTQ